MYLEKNKKCVYCSSKKRKIYNYQKFIKNYYIEAIKSDLNISYKVSSFKILETTLWSEYASLTPLIS